MAFSVIDWQAEEARRLPPRPQESNKGTFGRVLCVCGSVGMSGAAYFAAKAAYRVGAGLVRILTVEENRAVLQTMLPEAIVTTYDAEAPDLSTIEDAAAWADVLVIGCGLGVTRTSRTVLAHLLRTSEKPKVLDADALNLLSRNPSLLKYTRGAILTPHPMELSRLIGHSVEEILDNSETVAHELAEKYGAVCVLKRHRTLTADGQGTVYRNTTGNSGMATGGSGDVLAGMIGGLWAQLRDGEMPPAELAATGVLLHGMSGDLAARELGEHAVMASDLLDALPVVMKWAERGTEQKEELGEL